MSWRAELVNADQTRVASILGTIEPFDRSAMEIETFRVTVPLDSQAGTAILAAPVLPLLEVQLWRDDRCVVSGPIIEAPADFATGLIQVECRGALHHLDRTLTGPAQLENQAANPNFATDLTGWSRWLTTFVEGGGFASIVWIDFDGSVSQITQVASGASGAPNAPTPNTGWAKLDGSALAEDEELQLYQDLTVPASGFGPVQVTVRALFWTPEGQTFEPPDPGAVGRTNLDHVLIATVHDPDAPGGFDPPTPVGYIDFLTPPSVVSWDDIWAGRYDDIECTVEIPPGTGDRLVHLSLIPPRLVTYATLVEMTVDRPLELSGYATDRPQQLIDHAQDPAYDHVDRQIVGTLIGSASSVIDEQPIYESERRSVYQTALDQPAESGFIEWRTAYTGTTRTVEYGLPPQGAQLPLPIAVTDAAVSGHIATATFRRMWGSGSTSVSGQSSQGQVRSDAAAVSVPNDLGWEEVFVAPDWIQRWGLQAWTEARLAETSEPEALELVFDPDHPLTEPWRDGTIDVLDRVPVNFDRDGTVLSGWWQVRQLRFDPATDSVSSTLVPEVT